jgi:transcriptional regulator with XRE-family HTH domain
LDDDLKRIAARLRGWRDEAGLTLQKLGDRSGVSASTIHKIENLQTVPTISVLLKVANGLNRRPSELLEDIEVGKQVAILRGKDRKRIPVSDKTSELEHLVGMIPRNRFDVWRIHLGSGKGPGRSGTDAWHFQGELVLLVEAGCIEVELGGESYVVETSDSIHFDASVSHSWVAGQGKPARVIAVAMIPEHLQADIKMRASAVAVAGIETLEVETVETVEASDAAFASDRSAS